MTIRVRFAPSPTGLLHVGNIRTALINWLFTKSKDGQFVLRLDDTDKQRSRPEFAKAIEDDLLWLGLTFDEKKRQSEHETRYNEVFEDFKARGLIYPCYETPEELSLKRKTQLNQGKPPLYDRAALALSDEDRKKLEAEGRKPHWRFKLNEDPIEWVDMVRGIVKFKGQFASDPVLWREDGLPMYTIASVIDDADMNITHILRGEDHVANTAVQVKVFEALGAKVPAFGHLPLISDAEGGGLSKRLGSMGVRELKEEGFEPLSLSCVLSKLGIGDEVVPALHMEDLAYGFDISKFGRGTPKFNIADVEHMNTRILQIMPYETAQKRFDELDIPHLTEEQWVVVQDNVNTLKDVRRWHIVFEGHIQAAVSKEDQSFYEEALDLFPEETIDDETWSKWTSALKEKTDRKGKALFMPLRKALTGFDHGPEMSDLLPLIGLKKIIERLTDAAHTPL